MTNYNLAVKSVFILTRIDLKSNLLWYPCWADLE